MANTITVSPIAATLLAALLVGEPIGASLLMGIAAVAGGIWIASTERLRPGDPTSDASLSRAPRA